MAAAASAAVGAVTLVICSRRFARRARGRRQSCRVYRATDAIASTPMNAAVAASTLGLPTQPDEVVSARSVAAALLELPLRQLKRELEIRGVDTSASPDRPSLLELGAQRGILPDSTSSSADSGGRRRRRRSQLDEASPPPVVVAMRRGPPLQQYLPSGAFTDGERIALPLWLEAEQDFRPMWFLLDTAIRRTTITSTTATRLGVPSTGGLASGLFFAGLPLGDLKVQVVPDDMPVLGPPSAGIAGLLGPDFLYSWDLDFDMPRGLCSAWPAGSELPRGFGPPDSVEIELQGKQGLLEVSAQLRGTACSGSETPGPLLRAVVDLGQTFSACNWAAARQVGIAGADAPCVQPAGQWLDLDGGQIDVYEADLGVELPGRVSGVLSGARVCAQRLFWLADRLPLLERLGFNPSEPMAVLGLDTVVRARLAVSARHRKLWLPM